MICNRRSTSTDNMCRHSVTPTGQCIIPLQPMVGGFDLRFSEAEKKRLVLSEDCLYDNYDMEGTT